jgi:hypothetical protein
VQEEIRLQSCSEQQGEVDAIGLVGRQRRVARKDSRRRMGQIQKKDLSKVMCFDVMRWDIMQASVH